MFVRSDSFADGARIPGDNAFAVPADVGHVALAANRSPHLVWGDAPEGTKSFAIICHDPDVPSVGDDVNQEGKSVPHDLPRVDFFHWVLVDIPPHIGQLVEGADSDGVTAGGKDAGPTDHGVRGINNYTDWFAGDEAMGGDYGGYDGPGPPWNDLRLHHYVFTVYALDCESLGLSGRFGGPEALAAITAHILDRASITGTYTLNKALLG